ncbi:MAG: protein-glutamate O-methyltransferase CheR [Archangium sp.]|nr:protein-glutamate O-methyltransferase CheR [Archangium sp.]
MSPELDAILGLVRQRTGVDFSRYREATVERRVANRMISVGARSFGSYLVKLEADQDEARHLLSRISIKVSRFYRHAPTFEAVRQRVLPLLAARRKPLRIWSAGCGCGEEPYTLALLLEEANVPGTVLATDIDPQALEAAQRGLYSADALAELPAALAERALLELDDGKRPMFAVRDEVRARVRFMRHDLLFASAPGDGMFDLVSCRNVLIYLQRDVREEVFGALRRAVRPGGFLCLGEAEWPSTPLDRQLTALSRQSRVFQVGLEGSNEAGP